MVRVTNYDATQAVFKMMSKDDKWNIKDAGDKGREVGVIVPCGVHVPRDSQFPDASNLKEAASKAANFSPTYQTTAKKDKFSHDGLTIGGDTVTKFSELSVDQMTYLASVTPSSILLLIKGYDDVTAELIASRKENARLRAENTELKDI